MNENHRISTGNVELDCVIDGGFLPSSMILLAGNPGSGKTILSTTFLYTGAIDGDPGVYACFTETSEKLIGDMA